MPYERTHSTCPWCGMRFEIAEPPWRATIVRCTKLQCGQRMWTKANGATTPARVGIAPQDLRIPL